MTKPGTQKSKFKAVLHGYDYIFDPAASQDEKLYCLTDPQVKTLLVAIDPLAWPTRWYSLTNQAILKDVLEAFADDIRKRLLMPCNCGGNGIDPNGNLIIAIDLEDKDDGTVQSYAPAAPDDTFSHGTGETDPILAAQRFSSLCRAVSSYVDTIIVQMVNDADQSLLALGIISAIIFIFHPMAGLFLAGVTGSAVALINELGADEQAINDVKCCLLDGLKNAENTFENFKLAMADCGFEDLSNQAQLAKRIDDVTTLKPTTEPSMYFWECHWASATLMVAPSVMAGVYS